ncbi:MAG TPA: cbb3-type cytochrome c oxidase subunit 3 [Gemmatimonadaceae bacterium]|nr:cbb3-type cytochrome c oxidase subunit 3 [Gemmatimonadaceae bacterium]
MKLSDIMGHAGLSIYTEIALVIFLAVFIAIVFRVFAPSRKREWERASRLPLDDAPRAPSPHTTPRLREE